MPKYNRYDPDEGYDGRDCQHGRLARVCPKCGSTQSAERIAERGGFSVGELDEFIPGWRDEISEIAELQKQNSELRDKLEAVRRWMDSDDHDMLTLDAILINDEPTIRAMLAATQGDGDE